MPLTKRKLSKNKGPVRSNTIKELANFIGKSTSDEITIASILGISTSRAKELKEWVECEGTDSIAMSNFTKDLHDLNEVAYAYYHFGVIMQKYAEAGLGKDKFNTSLVDISI